MVSLSGHRLMGLWLGLGGQSAVRFAVSFGGPSDERGEVWLLEGGSGLALTGPYEKSGSRGRYIFTYNNRDL